MRRGKRNLGVHRRTGGPRLLPSDAFLASDDVAAARDQIPSQGWLRAPALTPLTIKLLSYRSNFLHTTLAPSRYNTFSTIFHSPAPHDPLSHSSLPLPLPTQATNQTCLAETLPRPRSTTRVSTTTSSSLLTPRRKFRSGGRTEACLSLR